MAKSKPNQKIDPNRYSKNKDIKPESKVSVLAAIGRMGLMLIGIVGIAMEFFSDDGWLKTALGKLFESTTSMMLIPVIIFALWLLNRWMSSANKSETKKSGDVPMYAMMAVGAYYLFRYLTTGSF
jgi:membrane protein insertase Oxa1/YidC/SpoIIIJ